MQIRKKKMNKEIYKIILEDESDLLVSEKHRVYGIAKATNGTSSLSGDFSLASSVLSLNVSKGINSISPLIKEKTFMNSSLEKCENLSILSTLSPISKNKNSGDINSNLLSNEFNSKTNNGLRLIKSAENTEFVSTTSNISNHSLRNLLAIDELTSLANSFTCSSVALDLDTIELISLNSSNFDFMNLENNNCQFSAGTPANSLLKSSGTSTVIDILLSPNENNPIHYLNLLENKPIKVKSISKVPYKGKIYDVVLIKRDNLIVCSGNSYHNFTSLEDEMYMLEEVKNKSKYISRGE